MIARFIGRMPARGRLLPVTVAALLLLALAGGALASRAPGSGDSRAPLAQEPEAEAPPTAEELGRIVERLAAAGVETNAEAVTTLAAEHGVGGAVRLLAWADASGTSVDEIVTMRVGDADTGPMGWGRIARELNAANPALDLHPGVGSIMGNGSGHGRGGAPGQNRGTEP